MRALSFPISSSDGTVRGLGTIAAAGRLDSAAANKDAFHMEVPGATAGLDAGGPGDLGLGEADFDGGTGALGFGGGGVLGRFDGGGVLLLGLSIDAP